VYTPLLSLMAFGDWQVKLPLATGGIVGEQVMVSPVLPALTWH
jgi:hypothetical protein